jgi:hypothetical protein
MKKHLYPVFLLVFGCLYSQTPFPPLSGVFRDDIVPRIDILIPKDSLAKILAPENSQSDYHYHATFVFRGGNLQDTVENIGFRLRGNTSRKSQKKSFKVSFNTYAQGRKWQGIEKLNLNGEHNDPAIARAKICWDMLRWMEVPAPRANHVELYINGNYFGLYINVEHIDEVFMKSRFGNNGGNLYKCLYPADLTFKGANPDLYKQTSSGRRIYELMTNTEKDDYSDLAKFIDVLNNTPASALPCELEKVFNVDAFLKIVAFDVLSGNWDGPLYNKNNFYLYKNEASGQFELFPYDLDNTFGIDWFKVNWASRNIYAWQHPTEPRPLFQKLMLVDEYRNRYSYYLDKYLKEFFNTTHLSPYLDSLRNFIAPFAATDTYRTRDYGFTYNQFLQSFDEAVPYPHVPWGIKPYINTRRASAMQQVLSANINPIIRNVTYNRPANLQPFFIQAELEDNGSISQVQVCYTFNAGNQQCLSMADDGKNGDKKPGDGVFGVLLPPTNANGIYEFFIQAVDNSSRQSRYPFCGAIKASVGTQTLPLVINEFLASNSATNKDEAGQFDDWVEILNIGNEPVQMKGLYLSDNDNNPKKWRFPEYLLQAGQYLIIWTDDDVNQGLMHTSFKLDASGEYIGIFDTSGVLIDGVRFGVQLTDISWGRWPNASGPFQSLKPTPGLKNTPLSSSKEELPFAEPSIFPNPFTSFINLSFENPVIRPITLEIMDVTGYIQFVSDVQPGSSREFFRLQLPAGLYFLKLTERGGGSRIFRLTKME